MPSRRRQMRHQHKKVEKIAGEDGDGLLNKWPMQVTQLHNPDVSDAEPA